MQLQLLATQYHEVSPPHPQQLKYVAIFPKCSLLSMQMDLLYGYRSPSTQMFEDQNDCSFTKQ